MKRIAEKQNMLANWLTLLTRVTKNTSTKKSSSSNGVFQCKTCNKIFYSFQALGGHRASHKRIKLFTANNSESACTKKRKIHKCSICGLEFPMGQALGGHMRRHRPQLFQVNNNIVSNNQSDVGLIIPVLKKCNSKRVLLDLNLTPYENELMLEKQDMFSLAL